MYNRSMLEHINFVTGFWKVNQNVTLGLFYVIGPADRYSYTNRTWHTVALTGLVDWSAFLELVTM